ncbi:fungal specific transcription factor domain-containing protein [Ilyonectria robusta]
MVRKAYVQHLEERLSLVESALQHPTSRITTSLTPPQGDHSCHSPTRDHSPLIEQSAEALIAGVEIQDDLEVDHEATAAHELQTSPRERPILKLSEFAIQTNVEYQWMQSHADRSSFQRRVFAGLPLQQQTEQLIHPVLEELQVYGALLSAESLQSLLSQQYAAGFDCATDCSRWAIVNAVFANAFMCRATNESLAQSAPIAWSYFKNSFSVFPELIIQEPNPSACEAFLYMAMFMLCTADIQTASQLTAAAVRQICNLGMHRKSYYLSVEPLTADRHKRVFWMAYILDIDLMHKCGLHSAFGTSRQTVDLPEDSLRGSLENIGHKSPGLLRRRAELAVIQARVHELQQSERLIPFNNQEFLEVVTATKQELQEWKSSLSEYMQPMCRVSGEPLDISLALLHYSYLSCLVKVHMVLARSNARESSASAQLFALGRNNIEFTMPFSLAMCATASRGILSVTQSLPPLSFFHLWYVLICPGIIKSHTAS